MEYEDYKGIMENDHVIVLDTNVYLELYRLSTGTSEDVLSLFKKIEDKILVPHQVLKEYNSRSQEVQKSQFGKYKSISKELGQDVDKLLNNVKKRFNRYKRYRFPKIKELESKYETKIKEMKDFVNEYLDSIKSEIDKNKEYLKEDSTKGFIKLLIEKNRVLEEFNIVDIIGIIKEGELRYRYEIPPGYEDEKDKEGIDKFGDLIIWKEVLRYSEANKQDIIFVTNDGKEDWWESGKSSARKELYQEFQKYNQSNEIVFLNLSEFYSLTSKFHNITSFITELELNAEEYISKILIPKFDNEIIDEINDYASEFNYAMVTDYYFNEIDVHGNHYELKDFFFECYGDKVIYNFTLKGYIETSLSREEEDINFTLGTASIGISLEVQVEFEVDGDTPKLKGEGEFEITSITEEEYTFDDNFADDYCNDPEQDAVAEMMDALEEYHRH